VDDAGGKAEAERERKRERLDSAILEGWAARS